MSAGTRSNAMTATAPAPSAMRACSGVTTSMITPPLSISAMPRLTRAVPVWLLADPFDPAAVSTAMSSKSLLIQSRGRGKSVRSAASADRLQLPHRCATLRIGQRVRLVQQLTELQRVDGLAVGDQLGNHCRIAPPVAVDVGTLQSRAAGGRRLEPPGAVHKEHFLAADHRAVEVDDRVAPPRRTDHVARVDPQPRLLLQFAHGRLGQRLAVLDC